LVQQGNRRRPGLIKDKQAQVFAGELKSRMSGAVSGHSLTAEQWRLFQAKLIDVEPVEALAKEFSQLTFSSSVRDPEAVPEGPIRPWPHIHFGFGPLQ